MVKLDYYQIGQRIRKYRKAHSYSQDTLAEKVEISTTHLSHIETGNTKLSLQVLVDLADALTVSVDDLLNDTSDNSDRPKNEIIDILDSCSTSEIKVLKETIYAVKTSINKYLK